MSLVGSGWNIISSMHGTIPGHYRDKEVAVVLYNSAIKFTFVPSVIYLETQNNVAGIDEDLSERMTDKRRHKRVIYMQAFIKHWGLDVNVIVTNMETSFVCTFVPHRKIRPLL